MGESGGIRKFECDGGCDGEVDIVGGGAKPKEGEGMRGDKNSGLPLCDAPFSPSKAEKSAQFVSKMSSNPKVVGEVGAEAVVVVVVFEAAVVVIIGSNVVTIVGTATEDAVDGVVVVVVEVATAVGVALGVGSLETQSRQSKRGFIWADEEEETAGFAGGADAGMVGSGRDGFTEGLLVNGRSVVEVVVESLAPALTTAPSVGESLLGGGMPRIAYSV